MDRLKQHNIVHRIKYLISVVISALAFVLFISTFATLIYYAGEVDLRIRLIGTVENLVILLLFVIGMFFDYFLIFRLAKKKQFNNKAIITILSLFDCVIINTSIIPLFVINQGIEAKAIANVVKNTYIFYIVLSLLGLIGIVVTIYLLRKRILNNNWWLFFISIPYIVSGWSFKQDFKLFTSLVTSSDFDYNQISEMLNSMKSVNVLLINQDWYKCISFVLVITILMAGVILIEAVWKKTEKLRS